jgi:predicted dehydrogenase
MKPAKYGVLLATGDQTHQENYAEGFAADPRARIVAVSDEADVDKRRRALNERMAKRFKVPYVPGVEEALKREGVDVVCICAPPERRGRIALRCARAGKHLYLDKSLVPSLAEADDLVAAVKKAGVRTQMFTLTTQPWAQQARELLQGGALGKLRAVHADAFFAKGQTGTAKLGTPRKEEFPPHRHQLLDAKREWDNVGVYPVTLIHWLTGQKFHTVYGVTANYFFREHQKRDVEDFGLLNGTLEGGLPVTICGGRFGWATHPAGGVNRVVLVGSERTAIVDANRPRLEIYNDAAPWTPPRRHPDDPMGFWSSTQKESGVKPKTTWAPFGPPAPSDQSAFLDCLDAGRESPVSVVEAAHATEVLVATYLSAHRGQAVTLPLKREKF